MSIIGLVVVLIVAAFALNWWASHHKSESRSPRSKVLWLKRFRPKRLPRINKPLRIPPIGTPRIGAKLHRDRV